MSFSTSSALHRILLSAGSLVILLLAVCQAVGCFQQWESTLLRHLPSHFLPSHPQIVLITLEKSSQGFPSMDIAMVLRGLGKLHPRCVIVDGTIEPEQSPVPILPDVISQIREIPGLNLIIPEFPSSTAEFRSVSLIRYSLKEQPLDWPELKGQAEPGVGSAYLPEVSSEDTMLPLLATTAQRVPIGSLWWWSLPDTERSIPPLLLFRKILLLGNHVPLRLSPSGEVVITSPDTGKTSLKIISLDDFLFQMEQKEQGSIRPSFDNLWTHSTVIIGSLSDLSKASLLSDVQELLSTRRLSLGIQLLMALGWVLLFLFWVKVRFRLHRYWRWILPLLILFMLMAVTPLFLSYGLLIPFLPGVALSLLLLIFPKVL